MKILRYRPILILMCICALVALYVQVRYIHEIRMIIECDQIFMERKKILTQQQLYNIAIARIRSPVHPGSTLGIDSDLSLVHELNRGFKNQSILTLITTFKTDYEMDPEKVLTFRSHVRLLLYTKNTLADDNGIFFNWNIFPILRSSESGILTKAMFKLAKELYNTNWYGYFNGDILLTEDILETLEYVSSVLDNFPKASFLIIGRRINVFNVTSEEVRKINGIKEIAKSRGSSYEIDSNDYFITNKYFPWDKMPEIVIGPSGNDNWIVGQARCNLDTVVIDATETLTAVYQITTKGENKEGFESTLKNYNSKLMRRYKLTSRVAQGLTSCAEWRTFRTIKTRKIELVKRDDLNKNCTCKK
ncbi:hypothetical protein CHS0354_014112 [Potamilus streckersoni]|uniref:Uncharacterized protein n=1 Tax=Potamilus streckersoni TaxID=2493646 RepID=A0AAE0TKR8_9BIVA|nr:hypothetical protein CHS0354_014112 [Potamilus streckersoni]